MNGILQFLKGLLPSFGKKDVREKLNQIQAVLNDMVKGALQSFGESLNERALKSTAGKAFIANLMTVLPSPYKNGTDPYSKAALQAANNASKLIDLISEYVKGHLSESIQVEGLTYQKATVLRLIELLDFYTDYSIRNIAMIVAAETNISTFDKPDGNPFPKSEMGFLQANQNAYIRVMLLLLNDPRSIMDKVGDIPEVYVDADTTVTPGLTLGTADPLNLGAVAVVSWIFHWVGIRMVDWDIARFERAQKEKLSIDLRLESLRQKLRGTPDARTQSMIEGYERELIIVRDRIARIEAKVR